ncbi:innexin unc-9-like [Haliotis cracherodii]|uniref:innexin unc-9-like n=1 Tax=Haliotis cracherodii TaxID=6455 RepID=UPI0039E7D555
MAVFRAWFGRGLDQDYVDSTNGFWTVILLAVCSVGSFTVRYTAPPFSCCSPAQFTGSMNMYTKESCFMKDMYQDKAISNSNSYGEAPHLDPSFHPSFHPWIPLILFFQALAFKVPNIIWNNSKHFLTLNVEETVGSLKSTRQTNTENRQVIFSDAARVFGSLLRRNRFFLALLYLFVKLLSCINLIAQFMFLTTYFRQYLAIRVGSYADFDMDSFIKPLLVKMCFCVYQIHWLDISHKHMVQCTLQITEINKKMFIFLWYWVFLLAILTILNLVFWAGFLFLLFLRDGRIAAHINAVKGSRPDELAKTRFISSFLGIHGVLVLSMISRNSSELVATNLTQHLYQVFQEKEEERHNRRNLCIEEPEFEGSAVIIEPTGTEVV